MPSKLFSQDDIAMIEDAIREAEESTSAELVPVVARESGRYDRAEDLFGFVAALLVLGATWMAFQEVLLPGQASGEWLGSAEIRMGLLAIMGVLFLTYVLGIAAASRVHLLRLPFIARREMREEVERSARGMFQRLKVRRTREATGVLIYVSLYEHTVTVLGDDAIEAKLSHEDFQSVCDTIIAGFRNDTPAEGMRDGIRSCGKLLAEHFPVTAGTHNALHDTLHLID